MASGKEPTSDVPVVDISDPFARQLMSKYLQRRRQDLRTLAADLANGEFAAIRLTGHNMYGSGAAYGLPQITRIGEKLENAAEARHSSDIRKLIVELEKFIGQLDIA